MSDLRGPLPEGTCNKDFAEHLHTREEVVEMKQSPGFAFNPTESVVEWWHGKKCEHKKRYIHIGFRPQHESFPPSCFCGERAKLVPVSISFLNTVPSTLSSSTIFYWGCASEPGYCGYCVACKEDGMIYELQDFDLHKKQVLDNEAKRLARSNFHFTYCQQHLQPALMSHKRFSKADDQHFLLTFSLYGAKLGDSVEIPNFNGLPLTVFMCPAMQTGVCDHLYVLLRKLTTANTIDTFVVDRKGLPRFFDIPDG